MRVARREKALGLILLGFEWLLLLQFRFRRWNGFFRLRKRKKLGRRVLQRLILNCYTWLFILSCLCRSPSLRGLSLALRIDGGAMNKNKPGVIEKVRD